MEYYQNQYHHTRNYGCRIREITENGYRALILENEKIRVSIYLDKGGDIYEFLYKPGDIDFMWKSPVEIDGGRNTPFTREHSKGSFLDIYEGGWQDLLPSIGAPTDYNNMDLGTHGEIFGLPYDYRIIEDTPERIEVLLSLRMRRAPLFVEKNISMETGRAVLNIAQTVRNEADEVFDFCWGQHPAIGVPFLDENCFIDVPGSESAMTYNKYLSDNRVIPLDTEFKWPVLKGINGKEIDLSSIMPPGSETAHIVYLKNIKNGWYGITNLKKKLGFGMVWDNRIFKHLWMWMVYRGAPGYPWYKRTYNIALEPWSSLPDSFDEVMGQKDHLSLSPGGSIKCCFNAFVYQSDRRIKGFSNDLEPVRE
jgi:hypothetical protein